MNALERIIRAELADKGALGVDAYMELCLAHPEYGYYQRREPFGPQGDFITAPDICQIFGELLGAWLAQAWLQLGAPAKIILAELGPGRGTLMADVLRATKRVPEFHAALSLHLVETSARLRALQQTALQPFQLPSFWHDDVSTLPHLPMLLVANEFFDALPIRQFFADGHERQVVLQDGALAFTEGDVAREDCPAARAILQHLGAHWQAHGGAGLIIDYGYARGGGDTLQAVKHHAYANPFVHPGEADITAHVDFGALARIAQQQGLRALGPVGQGIFLDRLGGEIRLQQLRARATPEQAADLTAGWRRLVSPNAMGTLFQVLAIVPPAWERVAGFDLQPPPME